MATQKEINQWLKESGLTKEQVNEMWKDLESTNRVVKSLIACGQSWEEMNISAIKSIPTQKQKDLYSAKKKKDEEAEKIAKEKAEEEKRKYYNEHFLEIMVSKIDAGENLTERELEKFRWYGNDVEYGENRRWSRTVTTEVEYDGRFFIINWEEGLTEFQENWFYDQPYEVEKITETQTVVATKYIKKEQNNDVVFTNKELLKRAIGSNDKRASCRR